MKTNIAIISILLLTIVNGHPKCEYKDKIRRWVICTHEEYDEANGNYVLPKGVFSSIVEAYSISLSKCKISNIDTRAFDNSSLLHRLTLSENKLETLKAGVLDPVRNLKFLNLSHNHITDLPLDIFRLNTDLLVLDLNSNRLKTVYTVLFKPLTKLLDLHLAQNFINGKYLYPDTFQVNTRLKYLDFSGNKLSESPEFLFSSFEDCEHLDLSNIFLTNIPRFVRLGKFKNLLRLLLNGNHISKIDDIHTFNNFYELNLLQLNDNVIEYIDEMAFRPLPFLSELQLVGNRLMKISDTQFQYLPRLRTVYLSRNLLTNVIVNAFKHTSLVNLDISHNKITYLEENFCMKLNSMGILGRVNFDNNPWQCACLRELLSEVKAMDIKYNEKCFNGNKPVCVTTNEFVCKRQEDVNSIYIELYNNLKY